MEGGYPTDTTVFFCGKAAFSVEWLGDVVKSCNKTQGTLKYEDQVTGCQHQHVKARLNTTNAAT